MPAPKQTKVRFPRAKADRIVRKVEKHLKPFVDRQMACGSYRRGAQMIGDIDFVVIPKEGVTLPEMLPPNEGINWVGDQKAQVIIDGEKVDFRVTTPEAWGATVMYFWSCRFQHQVSMDGEEAGHEVVRIRSVRS